MRIPSTIAIALFTMAIACSPGKSLHEIYLEDNSDSLFISGKINQVGQGPNASVDFLGYRAFSHEPVNESTNEKVKLAGLILNARSIITDSIEARTVFGNETDSCSIWYHSAIDKLRSGRSALTSISNFHSALKGQQYTKQREPDTSRRALTIWGNIMWQNQSSAFYYHWHYKSISSSGIDGWLVLNSDTLVITQSIDPEDENGRSKHKRSKDLYGTGFELVKKNIAYAAFDPYYGEVYIGKQLTAKEKNLIAAYFFLITSYRGY